MTALKYADIDSGAEGAICDSIVFISASSSVFMERGI